MKRAAAVKVGVLIAVALTVGLFAAGIARPESSKVGTRVRIAAAGPAPEPALVSRLVPVPVITTPSKKSNDTTPQIAGTTDPSTQVEVWVGETSIGVVTANGSGVWTIHNTILPFSEASYEVTARGKDGSTYSAASSPILFTIDTSPPAVPTGVSVVQLSNRVIVHWQAVADADLHGYNVYRATSSGGSYTKLNSMPVRKDVLRYVDTTASNSTTYYYRVSSVDDTLNEAH